MIYPKRSYIFAYSSFTSALLSAAILVASVLATPVAAAALPSEAITSSSVFPIDLFVFVPCADDGNGEFILMTGNLHEVFHVTATGNGQFIVKLLDNPQGISGTGQTTGETYHAVGMTESTFTATAGFTSTFVNRFYMIGEGPDNNFYVKNTFHVTVNPDGTVTSFHDNFSIECN